MLCGVVAALLVQAPRNAECCSPANFTPFAIPPTGSVGVSPESSIFVVTPGPYPPSQANGFTLANTAGPVTVVDVREFGPAYHGGMVWQLVLTDGAALTPSTEYALTGPPDPYAFPPPDGGWPEITRFTTAATYDSTAGTAPRITSLALWWVRYALEDAYSGNCVFGEYQSFVDLGFEPAQIPNSAPERILYTLTVEPKTGGARQAASFRGDQPPERRTIGPGNDHPFSNPSLFAPVLDPTREYCAMLTAVGDGDRARSELRSEWVCVSVTSIDARCAAGASNPDAALCHAQDAAGAMDSAAAGGAGSPNGNAAPGADSGCSSSPSAPRGTGARLLFAAIALCAARRGRLPRRAARPLL